MTPPPKQELQDALDEFNDLLYKDAKFRDAISLKAVQAIRNALKFTMACQDALPKDIYEHSAMLQENCYKGVDYFDAITAKIWEGI